jgi:hypothetical protein
MPADNVDEDGCGKDEICIDTLDCVIWLTVDGCCWCCYNDCPASSDPAASQNTSHNGDIEYCCRCVCEVLQIVPSALLMLR